MHSISRSDIGRVKKMAGLPWDMDRDWLRAVSTIGPRTRPSTTGGAGISIFFMKYPTIPKMNSNTTGNTVEVRL